MACWPRIGRLLGSPDKESVTPNKKNRALHVAVTSAILILGCLGIASAAPGPRSFVASPDIYKVIAQNDQYLVIALSWLPKRSSGGHVPRHTGTSIHDDGGNDAARGASGLLSTRHLLGRACKRFARDAALAKEKSP